MSLLKGAANRGEVYSYFEKSRQVEVGGNHHRLMRGRFSRTGVEGVSTHEEADIRYEVVV